MPVHERDSDDEYREQIEVALLGKELPQIVVDRDTKTAIVKLLAPSEDGRNRIGLRFQLIVKKDGSARVAKTAPEEVVIGAIPVTVYHAWLQGKSLYWLRTEAEERLHLGLDGDQPLAYASLLAAQYQLERVDGDRKEEDPAARKALKRKLTERFKWYQELTATPHLSESRFLLLAIEGPTVPGRKTLGRLRSLVSRGPQNGEQAMPDEIVDKELKTRRQQKEKEGDESEKKEEGKPPIPAAAEAKPAPKKAPKAIAKPKAPSAAEEPPKEETDVKKKAAKKGENGKMKKQDLFKLKKKFSKGMKVRYAGKNEKYAGKMVEVLGQEPDPAYGVRIKFGDGRVQGVSPASLVIVGNKK